MADLIYQSLLEARKRQEKKFVVLIDPDKVNVGNIDNIIYTAVNVGVDAFFVGGSLVVKNMLDFCITRIKEACDIPVILFPGSSMQVSYHADALLYLSLISGRNADLLIGKHVETAALLKASPLEIISTGYMLVDGGMPTSVSYMSNTFPIPANKNDIAMSTALAGELLGLKLIFMDAGSGAARPITASMINAVSRRISVPLVIGGGIRTPEKALENVKAGADIIVVGNAIETDPTLIEEMAFAVHSVNEKTFNGKTINSRLKN